MVVAQYCALTKCHSNVHFDFMSCEFYLTFIANLKDTTVSYFTTPNGLIWEEQIIARSGHFSYGKPWQVCKTKEKNVLL